MSIEIEQFKGTVYENGYGTVAKSVMQSKRISIGAKALYSYICSYAWGKNESYPTVQSITEDLGISEKTFSKYRKELEEAGFITVTFKNVKGINRNVYTLNSTPVKSSGEKNFTPSKSYPVKNYGGNNKRNTSQDKKEVVEEKKDDYKRNLDNETYQTKEIESYWNEKGLRVFEYPPIRDMNKAIEIFGMQKIILAITKISESKFMSEKTTINKFFNKENNFKQIRYSLDDEYVDRENKNETITATGNIDMRYFQ